jgi:peptidyl-prolyl cis-trans isomerase C
VDSSLHGTYVNGDRVQAQHLLADLKEKAAKGNAGVFATTARVRSDDEATKPRGGDTGFKTAEDLTQAYGPAVAQAAVSSSVGAVGSPISIGLLTGSRLHSNQPPS